MQYQYDAHLNVLLHKQAEECNNVSVEKVRFIKRDGYLGCLILRNFPGAQPKHWNLHCESKFLDNFDGIGPNGELPKKSKELGTVEYSFFFLFFFERYRLI